MNLKHDFLKLNLIFYVNLVCGKISYKNWQVQVQNMFYFIILYNALTTFEIRHFTYAHENMLT